MAVNNRIPTRAGHLYQSDVADQRIRNTSDDKTIKRPSRRRAWAFLIVSGVITLSIVVVWSAVVIPWWTGVQNQWQYGSSRITQMDANVGHGGECHFIAEYYKGAIVVIEIPYTNTTNTHTYTIQGIVGDGNMPVVLLSTVKNTNTSRLDLVVSVKDTNFSEVLYNTGSAFSQGVP